MANSRVRKNEATKLLMLGDSQVGKTSIMLKFCDDIDNILDVKSTVGEYFVVKVHDLWLKSHIQSGDQFEIRQAVIGGRGCHFFSLPWRWSLAIPCSLAFCFNFQTTSTLLEAG